MQLSKLRLGLVALGAVVLLSSGCSDPESRLAAAFDRGVAQYKDAKARGVDLTRPTASSGIARMGGTYAHYFAMPDDLKMVMDASNQGEATLRQAMRYHDDPDGRELATKALQIMRSKRKVRFQISGPFRSPWMAYHYD